MNLFLQTARKGTKNFVYIQIFKNKSAKFLLFVSIVSRLAVFCIQKKQHLAAFFIDVRDADDVS